MAFTIVTAIPIGSQDGQIGDTTSACLLRRSSVAASRCSSGSMTKLRENVSMSGRSTRSWHTARQFQHDLAAPRPTAASGKNLDQRPACLQQTSHVCCGIVPVSSPSPLALVSQARPSAAAQNAPRRAGSPASRRKSLNHAIAIGKNLARAPTPGRRRCGPGYCGPRRRRQR